MKPKRIRNLVVISDTHCGCRVGLHGPNKTRLDDGGFYESSGFQKKVYAWWREFWDEFVPRATRDEPWALLMNGDALDGQVMRAKTPISTNLNDQRHIAMDLLAPEIAKAKRYFHIRGTEAHVGKSAENEEALAESLGAEQDEDGKYARWKVELDLCGYRISAMHHVGTTGSMSYEATAVNKELTEEYADSARWCKKKPDVLVRSHRHRAIQLKLPAGWEGAPVKGRNSKSAICVVTPAWQGKTPFVWKIPGGRVSDPQFGGIVIRVDDRDEELFVRDWVKTIDPPKPVKLVEV